MHYADGRLHRARILQQVRAFFVGRGLLEVETPCRIPANAPEAHIDAIEAGGAVLQTSPELAMKRLLAAGQSQGAGTRTVFEKLYR